MGGTHNCNNVIPSDTITMLREKGVFNDNLVTITCVFNIEVFAHCLEIECSEAGEGDPGEPPPGHVEDSWNCVQTLLYDKNELTKDEIATLVAQGLAWVYSCVDPGDGTGTYSTILDCQNNCGPRKGKGDDVGGREGAEILQE